MMMLHGRSSLRCRCRLSQHSAACARHHKKGEGGWIEYLLVILWVLRIEWQHLPFIVKERRISESISTLIDGRCFPRAEIEGERVGSVCLLVRRHQAVFWSSCNSAGPPLSSEWLLLCGRPESIKAVSHSVNSTNLSLSKMPRFQTLGESLSPSWSLCSSPVSPILYRSCTLFCLTLVMYCIDSRGKKGSSVDVIFLSWCRKEQIDLHFFEVCPACWYFGWQLRRPGPEPTTITSSSSC